MPFFFTSNQILSSFAIGSGSGSTRSSNHASRLRGAVFDQCSGGRQDLDHRPDRKVDVAQCFDLAGTDRCAAVVLDAEHDPDPDDGVVALPEVRGRWWRARCRLQLRDVVRVGSFVQAGSAVCCQVRLRGEQVSCWSWGMSQCGSGGCGHSVLAAGALSVATAGRLTGSLCWVNMSAKKSCWPCLLAAIGSKGSLGSRT